ncbi:MAG: Rrf2 family transcriptional regulator [Candidatus Omnitrophota bacterium]
MCHFRSATYVVIEGERIKLITRDTDYAIRALCFIAKQKQDVISAAELIKKMKMPRPFLRKLLQILNSQRILKSVKGKGGGFILNRAPNNIFLFDLIEIFQGPLSLSEHIFKKKKCPHIKTCNLKKKIDTIEKYVISRLKVITLASLL